MAILRGFNPFITIRKNVCKIVPIAFCWIIHQNIAFYERCTMHVINCMSQMWPWEWENLRDEFANFSCYAAFADLLLPMCFHGKFDVLVAGKRFDCNRCNINVDVELACFDFAMCNICGYFWTTPSFDQLYYVSCATNLVPGEQSASRALFTMHVSRACKKPLNIAEWIQGMLKCAHHWQQNEKSASRAALSNVWSWVLLGRSCFGTNFTMKFLKALQQR